MNFFLVAHRDDGGTSTSAFPQDKHPTQKLSTDLDIITPPLDGTILPGLTRDSTLTLANAHTSGKLPLPGIPASQKLHTHERILTMSEITTLSAQDKIVESFGVGTAVVVAPVGRIGHEGKDLLLPVHEAGLGPVGKAILTVITDIQTGRRQFENWSVLCE